MDGKGATDLSGFVQATWFIVQNVEFGGEVAAWHFDQDGEDAAGASLSALIRWHFVNEGRLSLFVDNLNNYDKTPIPDLYVSPSGSNRIRPRTIGLQFEHRL